MTKEEQNVYNKYLAISRISRNKPVKLRRNFEGFEEDSKYPALKKICTLFHKFPQIIPDLYFKAPFELYPDEKYFDLNFFANQKAIRTYTLYLKKRQDQSPDSADQLEFIERSIKFIAHFCCDHKIPFDSYISYKTANITYSWMTHYKNHIISIYSLFLYPNLETIISSIPKDEHDLFLDDLFKQLNTYKIRFHKSKKAKPFLKQAYKRLKKYVKKNIESHD